MTDIHCPPASLPQRDSEPTSILTLASRLNAASNAYRAAMESRAPFRETLTAAGKLARAADALTSAIADAVACGENSLT
jgi:hypothetical protein